MSFQVINGKDFIGSVRGYGKDFYKDKSEDYYKQLLKDSQVYFTKVQHGEVALDDKRYYIYAPASYKNCYIEKLLPDS